MELGKSLRRFGRLGELAQLARLGRFPRLRRFCRLPALGRLGQLPRHPRLRRLTLGGAAIGLAVTGVTGCASFSPVQVDAARTGETVVRVVRTVSPEDLARRVYDDASLGDALAAAAGLEPGRPIPAGAVLVLPPRESLEGRVRSRREADELHRLGLDATDAGRWREAADHFRAALAADPRRIDSRYNLGLALMRAGEDVDATAVLGEVAAARPDDAPSRYAFGSILRRRRAWDRALAEFEAAAELDRRHAAARFAIARTLEDLGRDPEALPAWRRFEEAFPDDALASKAADRRRALEEKLRSEMVP